MKADGYTRLARVIIQQAGADYVCQDEAEHRDAARFFRSGWADSLFTLAGFDECKHDFVVALDTIRAEGKEFKGVDDDAISSNEG